MKFETKKCLFNALLALNKEMKGNFGHFKIVTVKNCLVVAYHGPNQTVWLREQLFRRKKN